MRRHPTRSRTGRAYLWMSQLDGRGILFPFEPRHDAIRGWPWPARGAVWVAGIWVVEYATGWLLKRLTGRCPWDYSHARFHVHGLIRWDYAPVWFGFGLLLERLHDFAVAIQGAVE